MIKIRDMNEKTLEFIKMGMITSTALTVLDQYYWSISYWLPPSQRLIMPYHASMMNLRWQKTRPHGAEPFKTH